MGYCIVCPECGQHRQVAREAMRRYFSGQTGGRCPKCRAQSNGGVIRHDDPAVREMIANRHPVWTVWVHMRQRCLNSRSRDWPNYGGRGIAICPRWSDFSAFVEDMLPAWQPGLTIERIDNDGNYEPGNCRWAPKAEQGRNTRRIRLVTVAGRTQSMSAWIAEMGLSKPSVYARLRRGMKPAAALLDAQQVQRERAESPVSAFGQTQSLAAWARQTGIPAFTIRARIRAYGWDPERALTPGDGRKVPRS